MLKEKGKQNKQYYRFKKKNHGWFSNNTFAKINLNVIHANTGYI